MEDDFSISYKEKGYYWYVKCFVEFIWNPTNFDKNWVSYVQFHGIQFLELNSIFFVFQTEQNMELQMNFTKFVKFIYTKQSVSVGGGGDWLMLAASNTYKIHVMYTFITFVHV